MGFGAAANKLLLATELVGDKAVNQRLKGIEKTGLKTAKTVGTSMAGAFKVLMAGAAVVGFTRWMKENVRLAGEQEVAANKMESALRSVERFTPKLSQKYQKLAGDLQDVVNIGDEVSLMAQARLIPALEGMADDAMDKALKASAALSKEWDVSLVDAAKKVDRTLRTTSNELLEYGIEIDTTASKSEKLQQITDATADSWERAKDELKTFNGIVGQTGGRYDDWREKAGEVITDSDVLKEAIKQVGEAFKTSTDDMSEDMEGFGDVVDSVVIGAVQAFKIMGQAGIIASAGISAIRGVADIPGLQAAEARRRRFQTVQGLLLQDKFKNVPPGTFTVPEAAGIDRQLRELTGSGFQELFGTSREERQQLIPQLAPFMQELNEDVDRRRKAIEAHNDALQGGTSKLESFDAEMDLIIKNLQALRGSRTPGGGGGGGGRPPLPPTPPAGSPAARGEATALLGLPPEFAEAPLAGGMARFTPLAILARNQLFERVGNIVGGRVAGFGRAIRSRFQGDASALGGNVTGADPDKNDIIRSQVAAAVPGLIAAGFEGEDEFLRAGTDVGITAIGTAIGGPYGAAAAAILRMITGDLFNRQRDPSEFVNVKVINAQDIANAQAKVSSQFRIRAAATGIDRRMFLRQLKTNVF